MMQNKCAFIMQQRRLLEAKNVLFYIAVSPSYPCWPWKYCCSIVLISAAHRSDFSTGCYEIMKEYWVHNVYSQWRCGLCLISLYMSGIITKYNKLFLTVVLTLICIIYWLIVRVIPQSSAAYMFIYGVCMVMRVRTLALVLSEKC